MSPTVRADSGPTPVVTLRQPSPLTLAAVECGVSLDDATAYNEGRQSFTVKYFNARLSRSGKGVQTETFNDLARAEQFAASNVLYGKPAVVRPVSP